MELLTLVGLALAAVVGVVVVAVVGVLAYLSATMFRSAGRVDTNDDYLPPELESSGVRKRLEGAQLNLDVLKELPGTEFVQPAAQREVEEAQQAVADATR